MKRALDILYVFFLPISYLFPYKSIEVMRKLFYVFYTCWIRKNFKQMNGIIKRTNLRYPSAGSKEKTTISTAAMIILISIFFCFLFISIPLSSYKSRTAAKNFPAKSSVPGYVLCNSPFSG